MESQWRNRALSELEKALEQILENLHLDEDGYETAALITMTEEEARGLLLI